MREEGNVIVEKSLTFAIRIVNLYKFVKEEKNEFTLTKQILRSGTAIGALVREAQEAESKADFIHKMSIALKEARETDYWIILLKETDYINQTEFISIRKDCDEIIRLLTTIIKSAKKN